MGYYYDESYLLLLVFGLLAMLAQYNVKGTFRKYRAMPSRSGLTGAQAARKMLDLAGLSDVEIVSIEGTLSDHYNPMHRRVCLSQDVYSGTSVASVSVACHECGHAIQHSERYLPLSLRSLFFPLASLGSQAGVPLFIAGLIFNMGILLHIGIAVFSAAVLFQLVTLPVEFNASRRALVHMERYGLIADEEHTAAKKVLGAAALTYVAAAAVAVVNLLRLISIASRRD